jgi:hypothetical protein
MTFQRLNGSNVVKGLYNLDTTWISNTNGAEISRVTMGPMYANSMQEAIRMDAASDLARVGIGGAASGRLCVYTGTATNKGLVVQGFTSQTANLTEWQDSANNVIARVNASGEFFGLLASGIVTSGAIASGQVGNNALTSTIADKTIVGDVQAINYQSGAYTLVSGDAGKLITINSVSTANLTIPTNASVPMTIGTHIDFIQLGAGQVTISGNIGVTINYTPGNKLRTQYAGASVIKIGTDTWCLVGDISA